MKAKEYRAAARARRGKYAALPIAGYDSRKECRRAGELRLLLRAGLIADLREQVRFTLIPSQRDAQGRIIERACTYKGFRTRDYIIKRKLMLHVHGIRISER